MRKIDIGSGRYPYKPEEGWEHLDIHPYPHVEYVCDIAHEKLPFEDNSVDYIRASHVLEHIHPDRLGFVLGEFLRVLKPGGRVEISVPDMEELCKQLLSGNYKALEGIYGIPIQGTPHLTGFTSELLKDKLRDAGFVRVVVRKENGLTATAFKPPIAVRAKGEMKFAVSLRSKWDKAWSWGVMYEGYIKGLRQLGYDVVGFFHETGEHPEDLSERIEIHIDIATSLERRTLPVLLIGMTEIMVESPGWVEQEPVRKKLNDFDLLAAPSQSAAVRVRGLTSTPVLVLNEGVDPDLFKFIPRNFDDELVFIYIGAASDRNGAWLIPEAFRIAFPHEKDVKLLIFTGGKGETRPLKIRAGSDERITIDESEYSHNEIPNLLARGHVFIHLALAPTWTLTVPEAMMTGMPCIVTRAGSFAEYFSEEFGWFVELGESCIDAKERGWGIAHWRVPAISDIVRWMRYAYEHRGELKEKAIKAAKYAREHLTWAAALKRFLPLVEDVWSGKVTLESLRKSPILVNQTGWRA